MIRYYTDQEKKIMDSSLLDEQAQKYAQEFSSEQIKLNTSQLRKFYAEVKSLERQYAVAVDRPTAFARILPMIKLLKAKSEYAKTRKVVPDSFRSWLWENVDSIADEKDFRAFLLYFEAVVGFSARYLKD